MRTSTQLKALIRNMAKDKGINAQILLRNYMLERLLERISVSKYREAFILKGGMLIAAMVGIDIRSTMDMDATIKGKAVDNHNIENILKEIVAVDVDDGVTMKLKFIEEIRSEADYPGLRATIETEFDGIKNMLKLDMTTGDKIIPREIKYRFKLMFEDRCLDVFAYNIETVLAEKLETVLSRSVANTRMRDFYDIYIILTMYRDLINFELLEVALKEVCENRGSLDVLADKKVILPEIIANTNLQKQWNSYQRKYSYASDIEWGMMMEVLVSVV